MRILASGFVNLDSEVYKDLSEPVPFQISKAISERLIILESLEELRPTLRKILEQARNGDNSSLRTLLECIINTPKSRNKNIVSELNINQYSPVDLKESILGSYTEKIFNIRQQAVLPGMTRQELFDLRFRPFISTSNEIVIMDRFLGAQLETVDACDCGAFWFIKNAVEAGAKMIKIYTAAKVSNNFIDLESLASTLKKAASTSNDVIELEVVSGFVSHDRHIRFNYYDGGKTFAFNLGNGLDIFRNEILKEATSVTVLESESALANENLVLQGKFKHTRI
jgi:hypothetical protein